jgi:hypothetical protein
MAKPSVNHNGVALLNITEQAFLESADTLKCEVAVIKAVAAVESAGSGFLPTGEVKILFEPHIFWKQLEELDIDPLVMLDAYPENKDILYRKWGSRPYGPPSAQWDRMRKACVMNINAAYMSASFGRFQIMGFNHKAAGYRNVFEFAHFMNLGELHHLKAFVNFIKSTGLAGRLQQKNWTAFARAYNGPGYKNRPNTILDDYDYKLARMYEKIKNLERQTPRV